MHRRAFLAAVGTAALTRAVRAADPPKDVRITRAVAFDLPLKRSKVAGKNARLDVHGDTSIDRMVRLYTNAGVEAVGNCRADQKAVGRLIGWNLIDLFAPDNIQFDDMFTKHLDAGTMPLWDLVGKLAKKPTYKYLGGAGPERVPVYDGSIYFADLLPQYANRWQDRFREEIDMGRKLGHTAFKIKVGRGSKWMPRKEGDDRDVEVVKLIRRHAGKDVLLGVDANNGYDLAGAKRFMDRVGGEDLAFVEELFPEVVEQCLELKKHMKDSGWKTLLADGETQGDLNVFKPFLAAKAIDVYQADMNRFGFEGILKEAAWAQDANATVAPHNWGSLVGYYMQLHVGRALTNFYRAEHDPLSTRVLIAEGYDRKDGATTVPDTPGFGLWIDETAFASDVKVRFDLK